MSHPQPSQSPDYIPALGKRWLTPLYDLAISLLTREKTWRSRLIKQISPKPREEILDVGCGTGSLAILLKEKELGIQITGIDPDPGVLSIAQRKIEHQLLEIKLIQGFLEPSLFPPGKQFGKITSSLVLHQVSVEEKQRILQTAYDRLSVDGSIHIADYGLQRTALMRGLFRIVQKLDGVEFTAPNAEGIIPKLMVEAGFEDVKETFVLPTPTGSISLYCGYKS